MGKARIDLPPDWHDWWEVSFEHWPAEIRGSYSEHIIRHYRLGDVAVLPTMDWFCDFPSEESAYGFKQLCEQMPEMLSDLCFFCNYRLYYARYPRWNIMRGVNHLWLPTITYRGSWYQYPA